MNTGGRPPPEVVRASRPSRLVLALAVAALILFGLALQFTVLPALRSMLASPISADTLRILKLMFAGLAALGGIGGLIAILHGRRILLTGTYPPPGASVWRDTVVRRGRAARRVGWAALIAGILACTLSTVAAIYAWSMVDSLAWQPKPGEQPVLRFDRHGRPLPTR